jgi:hypothetical protein
MSSAQRRGAPAGDDPAHGEVLGLLREPLPGQEGLAGRAVAGGQTRVADGHPGEAVRLPGDEAQADETAPVLAEEGDVPQIEPVEEGLAHPLDVAGVGVVGALRGLVAAAEADEVRDDDPVPGLHEGRDHGAVQVAPGGLAVHEQHRRGVAGSLVEVVDPQRPALAVVDLDVVGLEVETGQALEAVVGSAQGLHRVCSWSSGRVYCRLISAPAVAASASAKRSGLSWTTSSRSSPVKANGAR